MRRPSRIIGVMRGLVGAVLGGILGYYAFIWLYRQGFYALILPGTMVGLGFGLLSGHRSIWCGVACGVGGVALGIFTVWRWFPFRDDQSLGFFLTHLHKLPAVTLILILLAGLFAAWLGTGRDWGEGARGPDSESP